jgi:hypothetical protein
MRRDEAVKNSTIHGKYLGDLHSEPDNQVHSAVFLKDDAIHVHYEFKQGVSWSGGRITDAFLSEILQYLYQNNLPVGPIHLHNAVTQ